MITPSARPVATIACAAAAGAPARDPTAAGRIGRARMVTAARTTFHVSPFSDQHGGYAFRYSPPGETRELRTDLIK